MAKLPKENPQASPTELDAAETMKGQ